MSSSRRKTNLRWFILQLPLWSLLILLVLLALAVLLIRSLLPHLDQARPDLESWLSQQLPFQYSSEQVNASLYRLDPRLEVEGIRLERSGQLFLQLQHLDIEMDTWASFLAWAPRMKEAQLSQLDIWLEQTPEGWQLPGWEARKTTSQAPSADSAQAATQVLLEWVELLLVQGELDFTDLTLHLSPLQGEPLKVNASNLNYRRWSGGRQLDFQWGLEGREARSRLLVTLEGDRFSLEESRLNAWMAIDQVQIQDLHFLWPADWQNSLNQVQGQVSAQAWIQQDQGQTRVEVRTPAADIQWGEQPLGLDELALSLEGQEHNWKAALQLDHLRWDEQNLESLTAQLDYQQGQWQLMLDQLDLAPVAERLLKLFPEATRLQGLLQALKPVGYLQGPALTWGQDQEWVLTSDLKQVHLGAWAAAPAVEGLDAWLEVRAEQGQVRFVDQSLDLWFPYLYAEPFTLNQGQGIVSWALESGEIWLAGEHLKASLPLPEPLTNEGASRVTGEFSLHLLEDDQRFYLNLGLQPTQVLAYQQLVPHFLLPDDVYDWLDLALDQGQVQQGGFIYSGSLQPDRPSDYQLHLDFTQASLVFDEQWPPLKELTGWFKLDRQGVRGQVEQGRFLDSSLQPSYFTTQTQPLGQALWVDANFAAELSDFSELLVASPLQEWVPEPLHSWYYQGQADGRLQLLLPFYTEADSLQVQVKLDLDQAKLGIDQADLLFEQVQGDLSFDLEQGLRSTQLEGLLWDEPMTASIQGETNLLEFSGQQPVEQLTTWLNWPAWSWAEGRVAFQGQLPLNPLSRLQVTSDLQGVELDLPEPFTKSASSSRALVVELDLDDASLPLDVKVSEQLHLVTQLAHPELGTGLALASQQAEARLPGHSGLHLDLKLDKMQLDDYWQGFQKHLLPEASDPVTSLVDPNAAASFDLPAVLAEVTLRAEQAAWSDQSAEPLYAFLANSEQSGWDLQVVHPQVNGRLHWQPEERMQLELLRLRLPKTPAQATEEDDEEPRMPGSRRQEKMTIRREDPWQGINPANWPPLDWSLVSLERGQQFLGQWQGQLETSDQHLALTEVTGQLGASELKGELTWTLDPDSSSQLNWVIEGGNIAPALAASLDARSPLVTNRHRIEAQAHWPGSPAAFDLYHLEGELGLNFARGYFPDTEGAALGASRFFGLMNLDNLVRRMRLDFDDLTAEGVSFDRLEAAYQIEEGYLRTLEPTLMESSATRITLKGEIDLLEETLDQELRVRLPVGQTLPLAALMLGAPQLGVAIWAGQKVLGLFFDTRREAVYSIQGPLADPEVRLKNLR